MPLADKYFGSNAQFRESLRRPTPGPNPTKRAASYPRVVPAFTIQAYQRNTVTDAPPKSKRSRQHKVGNTAFRKYYARGDFPISMEFDTYGNKISWKVPKENLDYHHYLPMFFDGLKETEHPYKFFAQQGVHDLLSHGKNKILPVIPQLIIPIKNALNTGHPEVICCTLKVLQHLVTSADMVGEALVPYYRQILPPLNRYQSPSYNNIGDEIDFSQSKRENISDLVQETLEILERYGGEDAYINIKYMIPTYESCMLN
ncbi:unnamed protein product [Bemisia tabaci]|uniref:Uncharacterized protein n=1 Tax=Bemisia tabaci TaxID=7038 RepID=A0A9P0G465_BEMTA|nr:unnamed protein product [Bemisia tabaci]